MAGFLLDTSVLIALIDPAHEFHAAASASIAAMDDSDLQFVSTISIGEIRTGVVSVQRIHGRTPIHATKVLTAAETRMLLPVNSHVASAYGDLKAAMVSRFMPKASRSKPPSHLEDWIHHATGKRLAVNENDLWICAQGLERDLHVITCDRDFARVREAEPRLALTVLSIV